MSVGVVVDDTITSCGIQAFLERLSDVRVRTFRTVELAKRLAPDLSSSPHGCSVLVARLSSDGQPLPMETLVGLASAAKLIVLLDGNEIARFPELVRAGVRAFLDLDSAPNDFLRALAAVCNGEIFLGPKLSKKLSAPLPETTAASPLDGCALSPRQTAVLMLIATGASNKEMASKLNIAQRTVEWHRRHLQKKLDAKGAAGLVLAGIRRGLLQPEQARPT